MLHLSSSIHLGLTCQMWNRVRHQPDSSAAVLSSPRRKAKGCQGNQKDKQHQTTMCKEKTISKLKDWPPMCFLLISADWSPAVPERPRTCCNTHSIHLNISKPSVRAKLWRSGRRRPRGFRRPRRSWRLGMTSAHDRQVQARASKEISAHNKRKRRETDNTKFCKINYKNDSDEIWLYRGFQTFGHRICTLQTSSVILKHRRSKEFLKSLWHRQSFAVSSHFRWVRKPESFSVPFLLVSPAGCLMPTYHLKFHPMAQYGPMRRHRHRHHHHLLHLEISFPLSNLCLWHESGPGLSSWRRFQWPSQWWKLLDAAAGWLCLIRDYFQRLFWHVWLDNGLPFWSKYRVLG